MQLNGGTKYLLNALLIVGAVAAGLLWMQNAMDERLQQTENSIMDEVCANRRVLYVLVSDGKPLAFDTSCRVSLNGNGNHGGR